MSSSGSGYFPAHLFTHFFRNQFTGDCCQKRNFGSRFFARGNVYCDESRRLWSRSFLCDYQLSRKRDLICRGSKRKSRSEKRWSCGRNHCLLWNQLWPPHHRGIRGSGAKKLWEKTSFRFGIVTTASWPPHRDHHIVVSFISLLLPLGQ